MNRKNTFHLDQHTPLAKPYRILFCISLLPFLLHTWGFGLASQTNKVPERAISQTSTSQAPSVALRAATGETIVYKTQNGRQRQRVNTQAMEIPHLVLTYNNMLSRPDDRTIIFTISDLLVSQIDLMISLKLETQHTDPDQPTASSNRIIVYQGTRRLFSRPGGDQHLAHVEFPITFNLLPDMHYPPSDYYRYEIQVLTGDDPASQPLITFNEDYAFLLDRVWNESLTGSITSIENAGPQNLVVHYCDMFPYQREVKDQTTRLLRKSIPTFVETELIPKMVAAVRFQTAEMGFSWSPEWVNYAVQPGSDDLHVALGDGHTYFHGSAPERGNSSIAINSNGGDNADYDNLSDGIMSTFHHELFHNLQRSIALEDGGAGNVEGLEQAWQFFSEGTASFIPTVAQPNVQFTQTQEPRSYIAKAIKYIGGMGFPGELNTSYSEISSYNAAVYFRFLYEKCAGDINNDSTLQTGSSIIRRTLQVLYSHDVVDIDNSAELVVSLPLIMGKVFSSPEAVICPFHTFEESLVQFAHAIYALRLENGRCMSLTNSSNCGFYDPEMLYSEPSVSKLTYSGEQIVFDEGDRPYPAGIRSSYGIDFIEVRLHHNLEDSPLHIELYPDDQSLAEFNVQIWKLNESGAGDRLISIVENPLPFFTPVRISHDHPFRYTIPALDLNEYNYLAVIVTRVDANEELDKQGGYTLMLNPSP